MSTAEEKAVKNIPELRRHLIDLSAVSGKAFSPSPSFDPENQLAFMALTFAVKQNEHARSVLQLDQSVDSILIARSMLEGLSQLLWAAQAPQERPLRWRTFSFVVDWRLMRKRMAAGEAVTEDQRAAIEGGLKEHGRYFLTSKAVEAQAKGHSLPSDPYTRNWYGETEKDIFSAIGADRLYDEPYRFFSEWHHWRPGAFGHLLQFDVESTTFAITTQHPSFTATALAVAFQCLWQTMSLLENTLLGHIRADLDRLYESYAAAHKE